MIDILFCGFDVLVVDLVIEYDFVFVVFDYVYCIGCIVRVGCFGKVVFFLFFGFEEGYISILLFFVIIIFQFYELILQKGFVMNVNFLVFL